MEVLVRRQALYQYQGDARAAADAQVLLELARRTGYTFGEIGALGFLARVAAGKGNYAEAAARLEEAERLARAAGDTWSLATLLGLLGDLERSRSEHARASTLYAESQTLFEEMGLGPYPPVTHNLGYVALAEGAPARAAARFWEALRLFRRVGDWRGVAECVIGLGCVLAAEGRAEAAVRLFGAGEAALEGLGSQLWPSNRADYERWLAEARTRLDGARLAQLWAEGRAWSLEEALTHATEMHDRAAREPRGVHPAAGQEPRAVQPLPARVPRGVHPSAALTPREREVGRLVAQGLTNRQVAEALVVTDKTAANHVQRVMDKLGVHSRAQLAARAAEFGLEQPLAPIPE
jgi:non-specific serine/threonine protein kinase